ncbi:MAG: GGDEF domain-containing protein [Oscillospiraceae bacterium]
MSFISNFYTKYFGNQLSLKVRFFNIAALGGALSSIPATITSIISGAGMPGILCSIATIMLFLLAFIFAQLTKRYDGAIFIAIYGLNFAIFPALYFTTGGVHSGMPIYFVVGVVFTVLMMHGKLMLITLGLETICYFSLFYYGYNYPALVVELGNLASHRDIALDFFIVSLCMATLVKILSLYYEKEQKHTNELLLKLEEMSVKDPLTGAYNRRFLLKYLESGMDRNITKNTPVSIIMYDIDKFKLLNDDYGHLTGDEVIRKLSAIFLESCRNYDIVARYGGEEFLLVLPGAGEETAYRRAEQIRKRVESTKFSDVIQRPVTISGGVASFEKTMQTTEDFIAVADQYLYLAKESGRNKIVWSKTKTEE